LASNKQLGFVAALLTAISSVSAFTTIGQIGYPFPNVPSLNVGFGLLLSSLSLVGFILFLVAMFGLSKNYQDPPIFNYVLYGIIAAFILGVVVAAVSISIVLTNLGSIMAPSTFPSSGTQFFQDYFQSFVPLLMLSSFVSLIPATLNRFAFNRLANKSGVRLFRTVGLLGVVAAAVTGAFWLLGAALYYAGTITISSIFSFSIVGSTISLAAWILATKAFLSIPVPANDTYWAPPPQSPMPPPNAQVKYCPYCGAANATTAEYCVRCGKKL
jgi:uncharacterized membrane protein